MATTDKILRDPLYNYIRIEQPTDSFLLKLLDCPEVQRLRRIRQLGVSHFTYPGAEHNRLSHSLGVLHLAQEAWGRVNTLGPHGSEISVPREPLLAAALLHDVGHGPFSHVLESSLGIDHEDWSCRIVEEDTKVTRELKAHRIRPEDVADLIRKERGAPLWEKTLLSSQLDVDRLDYLRRDSLFTGAGYGHFDWYRILRTFALDRTEEDFTFLVWPDKTKYAIEEYLFARFYMYHAVYQHKTTRGYEKLLQAAWKRANDLRAGGVNARLIQEVEEFLSAERPTVGQFLALEDATVLYQLQVWSTHPDRTLSDLAQRFLHRNGFKMVEAPTPPAVFDDDWTPWENALREIVGKSGFQPHEYYVLRDHLDVTVYQPYRPEQKEEQDPLNVIFVQTDGRPAEISSVLPRLARIIEEPQRRVRYYVPKETALLDEVNTLRRQWKW